MSGYSQLYREDLLDNVLPFWMKYSKDNEYGGYYSCLDTQGKVYDTDKFIWLQARQVYTFAKMYDEIAADPDWLEMAQHGASFLQEHGRDKWGQFYFSVNRRGKPLVQPYNIFSDCFAAMGFSMLNKVTNDNVYAQIALTTFGNIVERRDNPKGIYNKQYPGTRNLKNFALPMILSNLSLEMSHLIDEKAAKALHSEVIREVMEVFYQPEKGLILENVLEDGSFCDSFEGRLLNPGHVLEAMWFIMDLAHLKKDKVLMDKAVQIAFNTLDAGWDDKYEGIFYFLDIKGHPPQQLEWDQKLWWVHLEALVCMAKAYQYTQNEFALAWFDKLHAYSWEHFRDPLHGEWFGYLNRQGEVLLPMKGGKWKGCFHVPRALLKIHQSFEQLSKFTQHKNIIDQKKA